MPLMGSLYIGTSGLIGNQSALNVSANNLANVDTKGYTRQQVVFGNAVLNTIDTTKAIGKTQIGLGVNLNEVRRVRDYFMDKSYRTEIGRQNFYSTSYEAMEEIETLFGEMEGVEVQTSMTELWNALSELAKNPNDSTNLAVLKDKANAFVTRCNAVSNGLKDYQGNVNEKITETIDRINELGQNIYTLNLKICKIEGGGVENANDLRDLRDAALDELGSLINISYEENENGMVFVRAEGKDFVTQAKAWKIEASYDPATELTTPVWPHLDNEEVFAFEQPINTALNTDIGKLKAYVIARGDEQANYTDIPVHPEPEDYELGLSDPVYQAVLKVFDNFQSGENFTMPNPRDFAGGENDPAYVAALDAYNQLEHYETYTSASVINNTQAEFDQMFHSIVTMFNDILCPNKEVTLKDGSKVQVLDEENCSYGADGQIGVELFSRNGYSRYTVKTLELADGTTKEFYVYNEEQANKRGTQYTVGNVTVNPEVMNNATSLPMTTKQGEADYERAMAMLDKWVEPFARLNPYSAAKADYQTYYKQLIGDLGNLGSVYSNIADALSDTVSFVDNKRQEVAGVSSDEELSNIIRYQNAYNASSRYITVINEMLGHLISQLGM